MSNNCPRQLTPFIELDMYCLQRPQTLLQLLLSLPSLGNFLVLTKQPERAISVE